MPHKECERKFKETVSHTEDLKLPFPQSQASKCAAKLSSRTHLPISMGWEVGGSL